MGFLIKLKGKKLEEIQTYLETAVDYIKQGKILAFPTDSVYGIGGDPLSLNVLERIYKIKFRDKKKGFLLLVADFEEAIKVAEFNDIAKKLANQYWPGQLTLILKKKEPNIIPSEVTAFQGTVGLRVPKNEIILKILQLLKSEKYFGGIIGTSANYSGEPPSLSGEEVVKKILSPIDLILDAGKSKSQLPSTIVDCTTQPLKFLRIGKITKDEIYDFLSEN